VTVELRVIPQREVERLLPMRECVEIMARALETTSRGEATLPLRQAVWMTDRRGMIGVMPAFLGQPRSLGLKAVSIFPGNHGTAFDSHQGAVLLFDTEHGSPIAVLDASAITAIRTAAVSAVATRALALPGAGDLAILGAGVQAASHLAAMREVRPLRRVRVWSRTAERARRFAAAEGARHGLPVEAVATAREAVEGSDLVCTTTAAREPVLRGAWLAPGAHVNAVGACFATARELDTEAVRRARVIVDRRESALHEAGDLLIPIQEGALGEDHVAGELGDVLLGRVPGRRSPEEVTLFESLGIAVEDLAAAQHVYQQALAQGAGVAVRFGEPRLAPA
jgi:ornithine cyclodeaminase